MSASLPPPERPWAERRRLRRRAALAAWRRRLARALLRRLAADEREARLGQPGAPRPVAPADARQAGDLRRGDGGGGAERAPAGRGARGVEGAAGDRGLWPRRLGLGGPWGRRLGRPPERWPRLLLAWQAGLVGLALALTLQSLLAPRWPRAELPREWGSDRRLGPQLGLGERRLRLLRTLPGRRDRDRALSETLVLAVLGGEGPRPGPAGEAMARRAPRRIVGPTPSQPPGQSPGQTQRRAWGLMLGALELRVVAAQVRKRSDLAVPRLVRDRPDLRLSGVRLERLSPRFSYARGWLRGRPALQTCLTGAAEAGYSEAQLSRLRDQPLPWGWPRVLYILGLRDNRDFSCLLLTLSTPEKANNPQASRQPAGPTSAP